MASIGVLRQIVTDIHAVSPQGLRKAMRAEIAAKICRPGTLASNEKSFSQFSSNFLMDIAKTANKKHNVDNVRMWYSQRVSSDYLAKVYRKEQDQAIKKTLKAIGFHFRNNTDGLIPSEKKFNIVQGLMVSKKAGLELPKTVVLENLTGEHGCFLLDRTKRITIDPSSDKLFTTVIHETAHKNDMAWQKASKIPIIDALSLIPSKLITYLHKKLITKEVREYAATDREEFIACTVEKLVSEQKSWSDLDPKIKKLYNLFLGPKIKTSEL